MERYGERSDEFLYSEEDETTNNITYKFIKRTIDIIGSLFGLIILSPILLIVMAAIKIESRGPVVFAQERVGYKGKRFKMYKFRSMVENAEELKEKLKDQNEMNGPMFKMKNDPRVTRVGRIIRKTSIDEIPQFVNVLKGDMSLVGPRPSLLKEVEEFDDWMLRRLDVKPGLTCYWQASGRNDINFEEWMKLDIKYIEEQSILVDIKLILKTVLVLFGDKHAS